MYAVIRTGGKQYRVTPGDIIEIEKRAGEDGKIEFTDVLAVSAEEGQVSRPAAGTRVVGTVLEDGRAGKILVFHYKRKKQYKKLQGHRQPFTRVHIGEISVGGQSFTAEAPKKASPKEKKAAAETPRTGPRAMRKAEAAAKEIAAAPKAKVKKPAKKAPAKKSAGKKK